VLRKEGALGTGSLCAVWPGPTKSRSLASKFFQTASLKCKTLTLFSRKLVLPFTELSEKPSRIYVSPHAIFNGSGLGQFAEAEVPIQRQLLSPDTQSRASLVDIQNKDSRFSCRSFVIVWEARCRRCYRQGIRSSHQRRRSRRRAATHHAAQYKD
jgi:hypothetical protein